ncbi:MAG: RagB/SusD family nutrient uptake outer membrane protein [Marinilabiliaceae bacterium]|nr:RagB/SusD family nutrient uptake outer membrane protein [Marinilabiliaceae bacterium]
MRNKFIILTIVLSTLLISSCEDNFDPKIYGSLFTANFPKTESDYEAYMMACYVPFSVNWAYDFTGSTQHNFYVAEGGIVRLFDVTTDISNAWEIGSWGGAWTLLSQANYDDCVYYGRSSNSNVSHFEKIRDITRFTKIIGDLQAATVLSDDKKDALVGEARLLRGLMMYYLLHIYGPVPVILDPKMVGDTESEKNMVRPTLEQMTEWITNDFEFAILNMPNNQTKGRYTADYARFCLMRHCLNEGSYMDDYYDKAIKMYNELKASDKGYGLYRTGGADAYANQFKQANKFNVEVIAAVSTNEAGDGSAANGNFNPLSWYVLPWNVSKYLDEEETQPSPFYPQGGGWGQCFNISPQFYDTFDSLDNRRNTILTSYVRNDFTLVTRDDIGNLWSGFIINKFPIEIESSFQPTDIPLARWADVLLMYAEAVARRDQSVPDGEALQAVNDVRDRAGLPSLSGDAVAGYEGFMDALLMERGHELMFEGCRKVDLIRFNKYRQLTAQRKGYTPTHQYFPIPDYAVQQAESYGKTLTQWFERSGFNQDN